MGDLKSQLWKVKRRIDKDNLVKITLPPRFSFKDQGLINVESVLCELDWSLSRRPVIIDFSICKSPNYQALALLVLYVWKLKAQGCRVSFALDDSEFGASELWRRMGAQQLFQVSTNEDTNFFGNTFKPLIAIRNNSDFKLAISKAEEFADGFDVEYLQTLRYLLSELLYNTLEHGVSYFDFRGKRKRMPSLIQFTWYRESNEIDFIVADTGVGIKSHLEQSYPRFASSEEAIRYSIRPQVSGTFGNADPYSSKNNAGVGLYISSNIIRRLNADMHIISGDGILHVSPRDITSSTLQCQWPGTFVLVRIRLEKEVEFALHALMQEFREAARKELKKAEQRDQESECYISIENLMGPFAEDKEAAIKLRDNKILPEIQNGKKIVIDFEYIQSAPHSFLSAMLATPIRRLGMLAYKNIRILNASPEIRETIDYILDENTEEGPTHQTPLI